MRQYFNSPDKLLLFLVFTLVSAVYFLGIYKWAPFLIIPLLVLSVRFGNIYTVSFATLVFLTFLGPRLFPAHVSFIVVKIIGTLLFCISLTFIKPLRNAQDWFCIGRFGKITILYIIAISLISAGSLVTWTLITKPNLPGYTALMPPNMTPFWVVFYMLAFALINAAIEELMWRGVMLSALEKAFGSSHFSLGLQAISFGIAHYRGPFLYGWLGVALTTIFGVLVGLLRRQSKGIFAPWVTHAISDFVILCIVYGFIRQNSLLN